MREPVARDAPVAEAASGATPDTHKVSASGTRLQGSRLYAVRGVWLALAVISVGLFVVDLPGFVAGLHTLCTGMACSKQQLSPAVAHDLAHLGLSLNAYAALVTVDTFAVAALFWIVAGILVWRRSDDWLALLVAYMLLSLSTGFVSGSVGAPNALWQVLSNVVSFLISPAMFLVFYLFPQGRFSPRWLGWMILGVTVVEAGNILASGTALDVDHWIPNSENLFFFGLILALAATQVDRYRHVYGPIERQQTKWVIFATAIFAVFGLIVLVFDPLLQFGAGVRGPLVEMIGRLLFMNVFAILFPLAFAVAILRYRLWDIDLLINRALVYGSLTALLAGVYAGAVIGLQAVVQLLTGQREPQPAISVVSTLLIAALFQPVRRRLQHGIDRRFYRSKYDAARTLTVFGDTLRSELDVEELTERLRGVVLETMHPAHVSLWLSPPHPAGVTLTPAITRSNSAPSLRSEGTATTSPIRAASPTTG